MRTRSQWTQQRQMDMADKQWQRPFVRWTHDQVRKMYTTHSEFTVSLQVIQGERVAERMHWIQLHGVASAATKISFANRWCAVSKMLLAKSVIWAIYSNYELLFIDVVSLDVTGIDKIRLDKMGVLSNSWWFCNKAILGSKWSLIRALAFRS